MTRKIIALTSGGLDSLVMLHKLSEKLEYDEIHPLFFTYGQKSEEHEFHALKSFILALGPDIALKIKEPVVIDLSDMLKHCMTSSLTSDSIQVSTASDLDFDTIESKNKDFVPFRNSLFLLHAAVYGSRMNIHNLAMGAHMQIPCAFPDSEPAFFNCMELTLRMGDLSKDWDIITPWINSTKDQILEYASKHEEIKPHLTFSCYSPKNNMHCGTCRACTERKEAFKQAGLADKTFYKV